ncbi:hypothetical protein L6452_04304 [Arctium lappa]|uniref:Uncharacterized protein n=1 Tax=Arctium lappa TaxID=4217 RepID=A0ACB9FQL1_ARCLA|nr:hypothetical protein L6452_04304 [Arctium lappa]
MESIRKLLKFLNSNRGRVYCIPSLKGNFPKGERPATDLKIFWQLSNFLSSIFPFCHQSLPERILKNPKSYLDFPFFFMQIMCSTFFLNEFS